MFAFFFLKPRPQNFCYHPKLRYRELGNSSFLKGDDERALRLFNEAVANAPDKTEEVGLFNAVLIT